MSSSGVGESPIDNPFSHAAGVDRPVELPGWWQAVELFLERASERLNPILVKEARQALKSRQFAVTFALFLICAVGWSFLGVALQPGIRFNPGGAYMLAGYYWVLAFPLLLIVPFSAFRSLASEREDGTFELLVVTTLGPRQIVGGKMGSAVLQMLVYLSALAPCIAFTYLLRGIDILTIAMLLVFTVFGSLLLSAGGLLVATATRARQWQSVLSVVLILALMMVFLYSSIGVTVILANNAAPEYEHPLFWGTVGAVVSAIGTFFLLAYFAAAARITFASENRSTTLRIVMLLQQVLFLGWGLWFWLFSPQDEVFYVLLTLGGLYWWSLGTLLTGELPQLSQRVRRTLPQSFLGRMFLTWLNPGPGAGFMFAVTNLLGLVLVLLLTCSISHLMGFAGAGKIEVYFFAYILFCYVVCYLGFGRLCILGLRRVSRIGLLGGFLIQFLLPFFGTAIPFVLQLSLTDFWEFRGNYTLLQVTNPIWTLAAVANNDLFLFGGGPWWTPFLAPTFISLFAGLVLILNFVATAHEVEHVRVAAPERVTRDELELHPERIPKRVKQSPWDE